MSGLPAPQTSSSSDVLLSLSNHVFAAVAAFLLAKGWDNSTIDMLNGFLMIGVSAVISLLLNHDGTTGDIIQSLLRKAMVVGLTFAAARNWISGDTSTAILTAAGNILPVVWSMVFYRGAPGPNLPGATILDKPAT